MIIKKSLTANIFLFHLMGNLYVSLLIIYLDAIKLRGAIWGAKL